MSISDNSRLTWPGRSDSPLETGNRIPILVASEHHRIGNPSSSTRLIQGDNLDALRCLVDTQPESIHCIYIDPPFGIGTIFRTSHQSGSRDTTSSDPIAYRDQWQGGIEGYLSFMHPRLILLRDLLSKDGIIFVHCDWRANAHLRILMGEVFGPENFRNEILWRRAPNLGKQAASNQLGRTFESILLFSRNPGKPLRGQHPEFTTPYPLTRAGKPKGCFFDEQRGCWYTTAPRGDYTNDSIARLDAEGRIHRSASGTVYIKYFLEQATDGCWVKRQRVDTLWDDTAVRPLRHRPKSENMGYDTQKPEGLLERIITWATRPGDTVLDAFNGSGTTIATATKLGRNAIGMDVGDASISITRRRLREVSDVDLTVETTSTTSVTNHLVLVDADILTSEVEAMITLSGPDSSSVTAWGIGYDNAGIWECIWYSGILRSCEVRLSATIALSKIATLDTLTVHIETQTGTATVNVVVSP
jgi:site-specific DNA-methyltransferase (adenine-specific)/adenine-specific DNA-methyltransferase